MDCPAEGVSLEEWLVFEGWDYDVVCFWSTYLSAIEDTRAARHILNRFPDETHLHGHCCHLEPEGLNCQRPVLWARWSTPLKTGQKRLTGQIIVKYTGWAL